MKPNLVLGMAIDIQTPSLLADLVASRLGALCRALALDAGPVVATFGKLVAPWATRAAPGWQSEISDDHTPIELSISFDREMVALRVLFEPQGEEPVLGAYRAAGLAFHEHLESRYEADLGRFRRVQDLFLPQGMQGRFAVWNSAVFTPDGRIAFKAYLNPNAQGPGLASAVVEEALQRLGLVHAWRALGEATRRGPHLDEIKYFALDLESGPHARVKIYVHHHGATPADLEAACAASDNYAKGQALEFARAMRAGEEPMRARAPFTCHAFTGERPAQAISTVYVPVCAYARDDRVVFRRVLLYLDEHGIEAGPYRRVMLNAAPRLLEVGVGLQSWIALRPAAGCARLTVYLSTEAHCAHPPGTVPAPSLDPLDFTAPEGVLALFEQRPLHQHPLPKRHCRAASDASAWLIAKTLEEGLARHFAAWLSAVAIRAEEPLRTLLIQRLAWPRGASSLAEPRLAPDATIVAQGLREALARAQASDDLYEAVATLCAARIAGRQLVGALQAIGTPNMALGGDPLDDARAILRFAPQCPETTARVALGAASVHRAVWRALDELYEKVLMEAS